MDLKVLFHNPESLSNEELRKLSNKIMIQRSIPYTSALFAGFAWYLYEAAYLRRVACLKRAGVVGIVGFAIGAYYANSEFSNSISRLNSEHEIVAAFDKKYLDTVLGATGFGGNYLSVKDYSDNPMYKKPY
jgi:hypothetical protein